VIEATCTRHAAECVAAPNLDDIVGYDAWARVFAAEAASKLPAAASR
jgi:hypothetical protein